MIITSPTGNEAAREAEDQTTVTGCGWSRKGWRNLCKKNLSWGLVDKLPIFKGLHTNKDGRRVEIEGWSRITTGVYYQWGYRFCSPSLPCSPSLTPSTSLPPLPSLPPHPPRPPPHLAPLPVSCPHLHPRPPPATPCWNPGRKIYKGRTFAYG